ncbi:PREDICTED: testican-3 [Atta cephalotes]|uniref:Thyroglobulin type-1 domain-containing protein n=1 Tax=Atta cephalotes TaxID=12957 RepID=A0A158P440_ATTCE|nr:PREDICTED: testican-3 [Atta cephalotes]
MRFSWMLAATVLLVLATGVKCKRRFDGDFEFAEEDDPRIMKVGDKKRWIHDPNSELCRPLNCKKKELCLLEDTFTAVCVSKKELHKSGDIVIPKSRAVQQRRMRTETSVDSDDDDAFFDSEDDDDDQDESKCQECPVVKPTFLCGNDNRTYSSPCRLEYHNCIHHTSVHIACKGFCPCKGKRYGLANVNRYDDKHLMNNEVTDKSQSPSKAMYNVQLPSRNTDCPSSSKPAMANRLLDWFSVVMADSKHRRQHPKPKGHFPIGCQSEVRWMFGHLDSDSDGRLSLSELYGLEHDQNEPCLKPFLDSCDTDSDIFVSGPEWCGCFSKAERPCAAVRRRSSPDSAPACDSRGYYRSTQCHRGLGLCWCVDPHGVEFAGTRTRGAKPDCDAIVNKISSGGLKTNSVDLDDDEDGGTDSSQDLEGSADQPLDF